MKSNSPSVETSWLENKKSRRHVTFRVGMTASSHPGPRGHPVSVSATKTSHLYYRTDIASNHVSSSSLRSEADSSVRKTRTVWSDATNPSVTPSIPSSWIESQEVLSANVRTAGSSRTAVRPTNYHDSDASVRSPTPNVSKASIVSAIPVSTLSWIRTTTWCSAPLWTNTHQPVRLKRWTFRWYFWWCLSYSWGTVSCSWELLFSIRDIRTNPWEGYRIWSLRSSTGCSIAHRQTDSIILRRLRRSRWKVWTPLLLLRVTLLLCARSVCAWTIRQLFTNLIQILTYKKLIFERLFVKISRPNFHRVAKILVTFDRLFF